MRNQDIKPNRWLNRWLYSFAGLVILFGSLTSALLFNKSDVTMYPALIADAYREEQHHFNVPKFKTDPGIRSKHLPGLVCFASRRAILSTHSTV